MFSLFAAKKPKGPMEKADKPREFLETIAFVVSLVLMLKLFSVEAFVIPTGSMAETLYGFHKHVTCEDCGFEYDVNASEEVEPNDGKAKTVAGSCCPNCRYRSQWTQTSSPSVWSGDRVLVHKAVYGLGSPKRGDVVVFKFPVDPQVKYSSQNYIKRLVGLPGETIAIYRGDLYVSSSLTYPPEELDQFGTPLYPRPEPGQEDRLWEGPDIRSSARTSPPYTSLGMDFTYHNKEMPKQVFVESRNGGFQSPTFAPLRKSPEQAMAMRRIVYDNDFPSKYLTAKGVSARWAGANWKPDNAKEPKSFEHSGTTPHRLAYSHHVFGPRQGPSEGMKMAEQFFANPNDRDRLQYGFQHGSFDVTPITNFMGYNNGYDETGARNRSVTEFWSSDLMLEASAKLSDDASVTLELSKSTRRFQAKFSPGQLTLTVVGPKGGEVANIKTSMRAGRSYDLRFADFDGQLMVWIDGSLVDLPENCKLAPWESTGFDEGLGAVLGGAFAPQTGEMGGMTTFNDLAHPASIIANGTVEVRKLKLWQDTFYTPAGQSSLGDVIDTFYVQPGHFLCFGDNSGQSQDGRSWGLVPDRLMLGKAMFVFFNHKRIGFIR
ncbi:MAG: signal peptidase I [Fimbriiglobus sp.]